MRSVRVVLASAMILTACSARPIAAPTSRSPATVGSTASVERFDVSNVVEVVRVLAGEIGPREATSAAFRRAGRYVEDRLRGLGYTVGRQTFRVPAGLSNLVPVQEGEGFNIVAMPPRFDPARPHLIVGAHLDTVPQAPGAVDNATGIGIMLELARLAALAPPPVPVEFIAFGGEEARVPNGGLFGSKEFVASLSARERGATLGAIVIDRLGTGSRVPVCTATTSPLTFARRVLDAARRIGVPTIRCENDSSDHVSFARAGIPTARIGPDDYPEYHTARDVPSVLVPAQAERAGTLLWATVRTSV